MLVLYCDSTVFCLFFCEKCLHRFFFHGRRLKEKFFLVAKCCPQTRNQLGATGHAYRCLSKFHPFTLFKNNNFREITLHIIVIIVNIFSQVSNVEEMAFFRIDLSRNAGRPNSYDFAF